MKSVTINKKDLIAKISANRNTHRDTFLKAQTQYRQFVIQELDKMLDEAKHGGQIKRHVSLVEPMDRTGDYDNVLTMLEMSVDDQIELSAQDFNRYVMDKWEWSAHVNFTNATYASGNVLREDK